MLWIPSMLRFEFFLTDDPDQFLVILLAVGSVVGATVAGGTDSDYMFR